VTAPRLERVGLILVICVVLLVAGWYLAAETHVVLFCAQDQDFAVPVLERFRQRTGLRVGTKFDTEADKSVSLYVELVKDSKRPRCDVFWNNEILSTIRLQRQGLLQPYASPSAEKLRPFPVSARSDDHTWHAFAARARVLLVNTRLPKDKWPRSLLDLTHERYRAQVVMARPQFGTSATQAACLFEVLGRDAAEKYYRGLRANAVKLAPGNKQVAEWVGAGQTPGGEPVMVGITDTDDALDEIKAGHEVALILPDRDALGRMGTLFIPNTVSILRDCPHPEAARQLVDYLLSAEVEKELAESDSHQIPFNPEVVVKLPPQIETPPAVKAMDVDFGKAADLWEPVQTFLRNEFARP
jgi:iron(III) transport system substrate-binding protein